MPDRPPARTFFQQFLLYWLPVLLYVTVILTLSAQPHLQPPLHFRNADKLCHLIEYGGLGVLLARALRGSMRVSVPLFAGLMAIGLGSMIGAGDEYFQSFVPGRESSVFDWMADTLGVIVAQVAYVVGTRRMTRTARDTRHAPGEERAWR
ncbi:MAG: VanZ family protein [Candidatus Eisenbacteria bacterium]|nr:VanZ family protein [Candidatus Eisenbacteria bacterium]